jgi:CBS domain containing-hemolysin-like protein
MIGNLLLLLLALVLVLLNGFFVAAEFALVKLRHTQALGLAERHGWRGRLLLNVHEHLDTYLSACQLGITLASLGLGWVGEPAFAHLLQPLFDALGLPADAARLTSFVIAFSVISFLHIVIGELAPKSMAIRRPDRMSLWTAAPLYLFYWTMYPAIWLLNTSANVLLRTLGWGDVEHTSHRYSREELKLIVDRQGGGSTPDQDLALMSHALELPDLVAGDLMRAREYLRSLRDGMNLQHVLAEFAQSRYTRYPWFGADNDDLVGVLHVKDLLVELANGRHPEDLRALLRPANLVALETPVTQVLERFRSGGGTHMALCVDEHARILGYFTLEDLLEVVVGDIEDEHVHVVKDAPAHGPDGSLLVSGTTSIFRLERLLGHDLEAPEHINSVGGLIVHRLQRLPEEGESLELDGNLVTVRRMAGHRIQVVAVIPTPKTGAA